MARVEITFFTVGNRSVEGGSMPVPRASGMATEVIASSAASQATTRAVAAQGDTGFARVLADADVWIVAGATPVASVPATGQVGAGLRAKAGIAVDLALADGDRIAVINA